MTQDNHDQQAKAVARVLAAIEAVKNGEMVVMVDDEDRENEGDLVMAAEFITAEKINFMASKARGLICLTLEPDYVDRLELPLMTDRNKSRASMGTAFTVSIEAKHGVTTGISAADRAHTIKVAIAPDTKCEDLVVPGHVFPLRAQEGGVLTRAGHTEGSVDLARLSGLRAAGVVCEIMNDDGTMARRPELEHFAREHRLCFVSIEDLITFRLLQESHIERMELGTIDTSWGRFQAASYRSLIDSHCHLAVTSDGLDPEAVVDVRVQRQDYYGDIFGGLTQGSRQKIDYGMQLVKKEKNAVFLFLSSDLPQKAYLDSFRRLLLKGSEQEIFAKEKSVSDSQMDLRQLGIGAQILKDLGVKRMRLHLSRPISLKGLGGFGLEVMGTTLIKN